jgi:hypothetical protein
MDIRPPTDKELRQLPHIILTSDAAWDPSTLDDEFSCEEISQDAPFDVTALNLDPRVNVTGEYTGNLQDDIDLILADCHQTRTVSNTVTVAKPDFELVRPFFGWVPVDRIKKTIDSTTQFAWASVRLPSSPVSLPTMFINGMKVWRLTPSSGTLLLMMMASSVMLELLWLNSMLEKPVPRLSSTLCASNPTCPRLSRI